MMCLILWSISQVSKHNLAHEARGSARHWAEARPNQAFPTVLQQQR